MMTRIVLAFAFVTAVSPGVLAAADKADCKPIPKGKRILKLNLKPNSALVDLFNVYSMLTCKRLNVSADLSEARVTIPPQGEISIEELAQLVRSNAEKAKVVLEETERTIEVSSRK